MFNLILLLMKKIIILLYAILFICACYVAQAVKDPGWIVYGVLLLSFIILLPVSIYRDRQREKKNPFNEERINKALQYVLSQGYGTKSSFITNNSEDLYIYFLERGIIHELRNFTYVESKKPGVWEITVKGMNIAKQYSNN